MRRFLFIGNGFDIAHDKATKYMDFLYACCLITGKEYKYKPNEDYKKTLDKYALPFKERYGKVKDFVDLINNNFFINYFIDAFNEKKENWIDFESEIKELCEKSVEKGVLYKYIGVDNGFPKYETKTIEEASDELRNLIILLNAYLSLVDEHSVDIYYREILDFAPTDVISFNYSTTFKKAYYNNADVDYLHGELNPLELNKSNIVLGFNSMDDNKNNVKYADFLKQFQMVNKDVNYHILTEFEDVIDDLYKNENEEGFYSMFFGHSLDETDSDIIKIAFCMSKKIYLVYFDENHKASMIKNILDIFEEKDFRKLCLSSRKKVFFIKQSEREFYNYDKEKAVNNLFSIVNNDLAEIKDISRTIKNIDLFVDPSSVGCYSICEILKEKETLYGTDIITENIVSLYKSCIKRQKKCQFIFDNTDQIKNLFIRKNILEVKDILVDNEDD